MGKMKQLAVLVIILLSACTLFADELRTWNYTDSFGDITDSLYIGPEASKHGTFSNSATTDSELRWDIAVDDSDVAFFLYEYGSTQLRGSSGFPDKYDILVKDGDGVVHTFHGSNFSDRILLDKSSAGEMRDVMKKDGIIRIVINEDTRYTASTYNLGSLDCSGFSDLYKKAFGVVTEIVAESHVMEEASKYIEGYEEDLRSMCNLVLSVSDADGMKATDSDGIDYASVRLEAAYGVTHTATASLYIDSSLIARKSIQFIPENDNTLIEVSLGLDDTVDNALDILHSVLDEIDAERKAEQEKAASDSSGKKYEVSVATVKHKPAGITIGLNAGYYGSMLGTDYLRFGASFTYLPASMGGLGIGFRLDSALYTVTGYDIGYPGYDITASVYFGGVVGDLGRVGIVLDTAYGIGYGKAVSSEGETINGFLARMILGMGFRFASGFEIAVELMMDMLSYNYYDPFWDDMTLGIDLSLVPMISCRYCF